jgi:ADP-heptose:LPS heptosyltransferase
MVAGRARVMQALDPRKVRVTYQGKPRWSEIWENNPRFARLEERGDFQELPARNATNNRPYHLAKSDAKWTYNPGFRADRGELYFSAAEKAFGERHRGLVVIEPNIKLKASPNKQWGWERWQRLADLLNAAGIKPTQLVGAPGARVLSGVGTVPTPSFRMACAVIGGARACILPEGGPHHAAAALNVPAVVIFGGFTPVELTGYEGHRNLGVTVADACGMRTPCQHCAAEMARITPEAVLEEFVRILR